MAELVIVFGKSGSGKSRSLYNFAEDQILLINVADKRLPFRKKFTYTLKANSTPMIISYMVQMSKKHPEVKTFVIDDFGFTMADYFLAEHSKGRTGRAVYDLYNELGDQVNALVKAVKDELPEDVIVYMIMHEDIADDGTFKLRTVGKMVDNYINLEGRVSICLRCVCVSGEHKFITASNDDISKSPEEMFETEIPNDLAEVDKKIREYWGL